MKLKEMNKIDIILELEGGDLVLEDFDDLEILKDICREFASSQGFYGRLLRDIENADLSDDSFPIIL